MTTYQYNDEVIEAARILKKALLDDSPFGNEGAAQDWLSKNYNQVCMIAKQVKEGEINFENEILK